MSKRWTIDCYTKCYGWPENTYISDDPEKVKECLIGLINNKKSGIARIVINDAYYNGKPEHVGMAPMDLDEQGD